MIGQQDYFLNLLSGGMGLLSLVLTVVMVMGLWKTFEKADVSGFWAFVPFVNLFKMTEIGGVNPVILIGYLAGIIPFIGWLAVLGINAYIGYNFVEKYGFGIGGFLLYAFATPLMLIYMGFSNNVQYKG